MSQPERRAALERLYEETQKARREGHGIAVDVLDALAAVEQAAPEGITPALRDEDDFTHYFNATARLSKKLADAQLAYEMSLRAQNDAMVPLIMTLSTELEEARAALREAQWMLDRLTAQGPTPDREKYRAWLVSSAFQAAIRQS